MQFPGLSAWGRLRVWSAPERGDLPTEIIDKITIETLEQVEAQKLQSGAVREAPWSGWYWPLRFGGLAYRYADPEFPKDAGWKQVQAFLESRVGQGPIERWSPAEKYDLLTGDEEFTLTRRMIREASRHVRGDQIEIWIGYCTGWANAASRMPRPKRSVEVLAADQKTRIVFRPDDIKALASLLWAQGDYTFRSVGGLCQESPVRRESTTGRALDPACRDTNPATFHLALLNEIGVAGRPFLIDSDSGYQVWNQPVSSYESEYLDPRTGEVSALAAARVAVTDFAQDPRKAYRASGTRWIVGVRTRIKFIYEKKPTPALTDSEETDQVRNPVYEYELELDANGRIIGGEWTSRLHPDLLWSAHEGELPSTAGDVALGTLAIEWKAERSFPAEWIQPARLSMARLQPLARVVRALSAWAASGSSAP